MVEFPTIPGCMKALNGVRFPFTKTFIGDNGRSDKTGQHGTSFRHYHYYSFPVMAILDMFVPASCNPEGYVDIDVMFLSEIDPTWNIPTLAYFSMPENALLATDLAAVACIPDAISSSFAGMPIQELFWCAGTWGAHISGRRPDDGAGHYQRHVACDGASPHRLSPSRVRATKCRE